MIFDEVSVLRLEIQGIVRLFIFIFFYLRSRFLILSRSFFRTLFSGLHSEFGDGRATSFSHPAKFSSFSNKFRTNWSNFFRLLRVQTRSIRPSKAFYVWRLWLVGFCVCKEEKNKKTAKCKWNSF